MKAVTQACPVRNERANKAPRILARERLDANRWRLELDVPPRLRWFDGHLPAHPVLPGIAQIDWAVHLAQEAFELPGVPPRIERVKFQRTVAPGDRLHLELSRTTLPSRLHIEWIFRRSETVVSRGRLEFDA